MFLRLANCVDPLKNKVILMFLFQLFFSTFFFRLLNYTNRIRITFEDEGRKWQINNFLQILVEYTLSSYSFPSRGGKSVEKTVQFYSFAFYLSYKTGSINFETSVSHLWTPIKENKKRWKIGLVGKKKNVMEKHKV